MPSFALAESIARLRDCGKEKIVQHHTRFKGLGEISPKEFAQFIGKEMRLSKVEYAPRAQSGPIFNLYMGKNTPERKDYIMDKLVVPVEE